MAPGGGAASPGDSFTGFLFLLSQYGDAWKRLIVNGLEEDHRLTLQSAFFNLMPI
jgi:hypothetical protein